MILLKCDRDFFFGTPVLDSELPLSVPLYSLFPKNVAAKHENSVSAIVTRKLFYFK